jgi:hypothetical protein
MWKLNAGDEELENGRTDGRMEGRGKRGIVGNIVREEKMGRSKCGENL